MLWTTPQKNETPRSWTGLEVFLSSCIRYRTSTVCWQKTWVFEEVCVGIEQACVCFWSLHRKSCYKIFACINNKKGHEPVTTSEKLSNLAAAEEGDAWTQRGGMGSIVSQTQGPGWGLQEERDVCGWVRAGLESARCSWGFVTTVARRARVMQEQWLSSKYLIVLSIFIFILIAIS